MTANPPEKLNPTIHKPVPMETRVRFPLDFAKGSTGEYLTGTVVGISSLHIAFTYIVLLDTPLEVQGDVMRGLSVPGPLLESEDGTHDWTLDPEM